MVATLAACGSSPAGPGDDGLDRAAIIEALEYWYTAAGISYQLVEEDEEPRLLIRSGTDGLAPHGGGRALIDGTDADNRALSGLVVFEPFGGEFCRTSAAPCRYLHRHEIGHALGFLGHSDSGLMWTGPDTLTDRERRMMIALYSLPHGAVVEPDGHWMVASNELSGKLDDAQAAQDIIVWNMNAEAGASYRRRGVLTRWELPVRVHLRR
jgi:hypothetical protein